MKRILKYSVSANGSLGEQQMITLPNDAKFVKALPDSRHDNVIVLYFICEDTETMTKTHGTYFKRESDIFMVYGTGQPIEDNLEYLDSVSMPPFIWHIFRKSK